MICTIGSLVSGYGGLDDDHEHVIGPNHHYGDPIPTLQQGWHRVALTIITIEGETK